MQSYKKVEISTGVSLFFPRFFVTLKRIRGSNLMVNPLTNGFSACHLCGMLPRSYMRKQNEEGDSPDHEYPGPVG